MRIRKGAVKLEFNNINIIKDILKSPTVSYGKCVYKDEILTMNANSSCSYKLEFTGLDNFRVDGVKVQSNIEIGTEDSGLDGRYNFSDIRYKLRVKYYNTVKDKANVVIEYKNGECDNIYIYPYYDEDIGTRGYTDNNIFSGTNEVVQSIILTLYNDSNYDIEIRNLGLYKSESTVEAIARLGGGSGGSGGEVTTPKFIGFINGTADVMIETTEGVKNVWNWSENDTKLTEQTSGHTIEIDWDFEM